ncbi:hypothetical protein OKJ48_05715 [Streptomyces kunmingensis]|uniref:Mce-associated membrane protein n=1 Tax=Streptomyces kunmingensis TaxID=68225 RepID=A0ABU6C6E2_9ACTN|nr:hypothetical protein [Streptomyces kunmingensis]MEB3959747.1 hypothetical protein [Streptomyces kunmingensis]
MSTTTRHHINRQRRLAQRPATGAATTIDTASPPERDEAATEPERDEAVPAPRTRVGAERADSAERTGRTGRLLLAVLCLLTLLLGGFAGWAYSETRGLKDDAATGNTALTDAARTSEVKGQASKAVNALFSYDHANPGTSEKAAATYLTGKAVAQHRALLAPVLAQAKKQKTVVTTTVTDAAVERIDGDRARVLVYADQSSTSTAAKAQDAANYAGAMLAVDLVRKDGRWLVSALDTFGGS